MTSNKIHFIWQIHQPFFIGDKELDWRIHSTYIPLIDALKERQIPFSLNITGSTLERMAIAFPELIIELKNLIEYGTISFLGSAAFHPILPWLPTKSALAQIKYDNDIKNHLDLKISDVFWPTELGWSMKTGYCAKTCGYNSIVIDSYSRSIMNRVPVWKQEHSGLKPVLDNYERLGDASKIKTSLFSNDSNSEITCLVRERSISNEILKQMLGEEDNPAVHINKVLNVIDKTRKKALSQGSPIIVAEDAERFLPNYLSRFLDLLDGLMVNNIQFVPLTNVLEDKTMIESDYIPASTMEGDDGMWEQSADDRWYRQYLNQITFEVENKIDINDPVTEKEKKICKLLLSIQDSGFYFWHYVSRTRKPFYERIFEIEKILNQL